MIFRYFVAVSLSSFLIGCANIPDVDRAVELTEKGDYLRAQAELRQLSDFGLPLAKLKLADMYVKIGGDEADQCAEDLYVQLLDKDPRAYMRLAKLYRKKVVKGEVEYFSKSVNLFKKSSESGDDDALGDLTGLYLSNPQFIDPQTPLEQWIDTRAARGEIQADYDLARLLVLRGQSAEKQKQIELLCIPLINKIPGCFDVLAKVYRITQNNSALSKLNEELLTAYSSSSVTAWFVYQYASALAVGELPHLDLAMILHSEIASDYPDAYMAMARLIVKNKDLGTKEELISLIEERAKAGVPEAHYLLGRLYFDGEWIVQNPQKAANHLELVVDHFPGASFILGLIQRDGYLGQPNFSLALKYLLKAARAGSSSADRELAEMYWFQRGVKRNPAYAYSFSELAVHGGNEGAKSLFDTIIQGTSEAEQFRGERLRLKEKKIREQRAIDEENRSFQNLKSQLVTQ